MVQTSWNLAGKAQDALTTWAYDDRYRLTAETVHVEGVSPATRTEYYWDKADNRRIKIVREVEGATTTLVSRTMYQNNALNQMTSSTDGTTMTSYAYDANGNRTNMVRTVGGSPATTAYTYDEDNRLVAAGAPNLVVNGDFEAGNTGFNTAYTYSTSVGAGRYYITTNATAWNNPGSLPDHTSGNGLLLIADAAPDTRVVWSQVVHVQAGVEYEFSAWTANLNNYSLANMQFSVNGQVVGTKTGSVCAWTPFSGTWTATSSGSVTLSIRCLKTGGFGNDFALDDISFRESSATGVHTFAYDYRSRRYYRSTPDTPHMFSVFDGGLSIQEYESESEISNLSSEILRTEFIRGEGMGGGVGGMVYSIKPPAPGSQLPASIICSHSNHRGDIIARSDENGSLTSFALYEAYGTRPYEWGDDPDRQKANTKEEESDLGLLNEGMRFRDLETGVFLTRDPIGYGDGPNVYCYVHCNPITKFDPLGLATTGYDYLDNDIARYKMIECWEKSKSTVWWSESISEKTGFYGRKGWEHGFVMRHDGTFTPVVPLENRDGGVLKNAYNYKQAYGEKNEKATYHAHYDSLMNKKSREPSMIKGSGTWSDEHWARNMSKAPAVVIMHNGVAIVKPDGTVEFINRSDLKPGDLDGSATKYKNYNDMVSDENGEPMVSDLVGDERPVNEQESSNSSEPNADPDLNSETTEYREGDDFNLPDFNSDPVFGEEVERA